MADLVITIDEADAWLAAYRRAWETQDADVIAGLFSAAATYRETPFDEPDRATAGIRGYWQRNVIAAQRDIRFTHQLWGVDANIAYAHWHAAFTWVATGEHHELDGVFRLVFGERTPRGLVCDALEEWWHIAPPIIVR